MSNSDEMLTHFWNILLMIFSYSNKLFIIAIQDEWSNPSVKSMDDQLKYKSYKFEKNSLVKIWELVWVNRLKTGSIV